MDRHPDARRRDRRFGVNPWVATDDQALSAGILKRFREPGLVTEAVDDQHLALGNLDRVLGRRLEFMRIDTRCEQGVDMQSLPGDVLSYVAEEGLGGEDTAGLRVAMRGLPRASSW